MFTRGQDNGHDTWKMKNFQIVFLLIFSNICCGGIEAIHRFIEAIPCVPTTHVFSIDYFMLLIAYLEMFHMGVYC